MILTEAVSRAVFFCRLHRKVPAFIRTATCAVLASTLSSPLFAANTIVRMETNVGGFNVELYDTEAPLTVTNFLNYVNRGDYNTTVIHRSAVTGFPPVPFIIQGGGYVYTNLFGLEFFYDFPNDPPVQNEFSPSRSNVRGTIAMAKLPNDPNSATSEWFINLGDNSANLDSQNGGFTVFGHVTGPGMKVVDAIADLDIRSKNISMSDGSVRFFGELPVTTNNGFVLVNRICINSDGDGACPETEDLAPGADGNQDGIADRDQPNVTTIKRPLGGTVTYASDTLLTFTGADTVDTYTALLRLTKFISPPGMSASFYNGMYSLTIVGSVGANGQQIEFFDGTATRPTHYYAYGPTPDNPAPHWYDFAFDGTTGAEIRNDRIILHFVDGERGDDDLDSANDSISHTGAQATLEPLPPSSTKSGGCTITTPSSQAWRGGDWMLVILFLGFVSIVRRRTRRQRF